VNVQLYSASEKRCLADLVEIMIAFNLTYLQQVSQDGQSNFVLQP
jgi:hypothetical protein